MDTPSNPYVVIEAALNPIVDALATLVAAKVQPPVPADLTEAQIERICVSPTFHDFVLDIGSQHYSRKEHDHDATYAEIDHEHDDYAAEDHEHDDLSYYQREEVRELVRQAVRDRNEDGDASANGLSVAQKNAVRLIVREEIATGAVEALLGSPKVQLALAKFLTEHLTVDAKADFHFYDMPRAE